MITTQQFLGSLGHETKILKHLHSKLQDGNLDYAPGENMRSTLELMRYLSWAASGPADALVHGDWSRISRYQERASEMSAEEFPSRLDEQLETIRELMAPLSDEDMRTKEAVFPWGETTNLGFALVRTALTFLSAYRLQLFCYVKATGASEMSTYDAWRGVDPPAE